MNKSKFLFLSLPALAGMFLFGCAKTDSTVVEEDTVPGVYLTSVSQIPATTSIADGYLAMSVKISAPKKVSSIVDEISNTDAVVSDIELLDNGSSANHDAVANDSIYSGIFTFPTGFGNGKYTVTYYIFTTGNAEAQAAAEQTFMFTSSTDKAPVLSNFQSTIPDTIVANSDIPFVYSIKATDPDGAQDITSVYMNVYQPSGTTLTLSLYDDGNSAHGDQVANDGIYSIGLSFGAGNTKGTYRFEFHAKDKNGTLSNTIIHYQVLK